MSGLGIHRQNMRIELYDRFTRAAVHAYDREEAQAVKVVSSDSLRKISQVNILEDKFREHLSAKNDPNETALIAPYDPNERRVFFIGANAWGNNIIAPANINSAVMNTDLFTTFAAGDPLLMMHLVKEGNDHVLLNFILKGEMNRIVADTLNSLNSHGYDVTHIIFAPRQRSFYESAARLLETFALQKNAKYSQFVRERNSYAHGFISDIGAVICDHPTQDVPEPSFYYYFWR